MTVLESHLHFSALLLAAALQACGHDPVAPASVAGAPGLDAGVGSGSRAVDAASPAAAIDAGAALMPPGSVCSGELPVMSVLNEETGTEEEPDWSCYADARDNPAPPPARQVTFSVGMSVPALVGSIDGLTVDVFFGPSTLGKPAASLMFGTGKTALMLDVPAGVTQLSANIHALSAPDSRFDTYEVHDYDLRIPDKGAVEGSAVLRASYNLGANLVLAGDTIDPSNASLGSGLRDCRGQDVGGAVFELIDGETGQPVPIEATGGGPRAAYSQFALPDTNCTFTSVGRSEWMMLNAPVNVSGDTVTHPYRLRVKGRMRKSDVEPRVLGEREVELFKGAITAVRLYQQVEGCTVISSSTQRCR